MDRAVRLADYLAGELDADEHAALEAELARDPALRADLQAMRAADDQLATIPPTHPPAGFEQRLDAAISDELAAALDAPAATSASATDELAARRARTASAPGLPRWVTAVSGAAAAIVVLAGAGIVFTDVLGGTDDRDDALQTPSLDAGEEEAFEADDLADDAVADGPLLLGGDRSIDDRDVEALLEDPDAFGVAARNLEVSAARDLARPFAQALGAGPVDDTAESPEADDSGATTAEAAPEDPASDEDAPGPQREPAELRGDADLSAADRAQVGACLERLLVDAPDVIPTYAELVVFDGDDAIVFGLVTEDPESGRFTRREAWIVDRSTCEVRLFTQR